MKLKTLCLKKNDNLQSKRFFVTLLTGANLQPKRCFFTSFDPRLSTDKSAFDRRRNPA